MSKGKWKKPFNFLLSAGLVASLGMPAVPSSAAAATSATDLIISEYVEGTSYNKAIELYNGTGKTIDLSTYTLEHYSNGSTTAGKPYSYQEQLENGKTYVDL